VYNKIFLEHEDDLVRSTAQKLVKFRSLLKEGELSQNEYNELVEDLLDLRIIEEATDDLERQIKLKRAFDTLKMIAAFAGGLL